MIIKPLLMLLFIAFVCLVGCTDNAAQLTLEANHMQVGTQIADLRLSATVQAARALTTLDFVQTQAAAAATQSQLLEATLVANGVAPASLVVFRQRMLESTPTPNSTPTVDTETTPLADDGTAAMTSTPPLESPTPTLPIVTPFGLTAAATPTQTGNIPTNPDAPHLENPVTATGVGSDDCATNITAQFTTNTSEIYIVAEAVNLPAGSMIEARWFRGENPVGPVYNFAPDFDIERACIWFFVDQTDFEFTPGQYTVDLTLNGESATPPLPFTVTAP